MGLRETLTLKETLEAATSEGMTITEVAARIDANVWLEDHAPELAAEVLELRERHREAMALCLEMGDLLRLPVDEIQEGDAEDVLARLDQIGKEQR
jgi:hypothetical protein